MAQYTMVASKPSPAEGPAATSSAGAAAAALLPLRFGQGQLLRQWKPEDAASIAQHANSRAVWINCSDRFPHPYTLEDAVAWIATCIAADPPDQPPSQLAVEVDGAAVGGIGVCHRGGVQRLTKELGIWLGEALWGRGIGREAVGAFLGYLWTAYPKMVRIEALVYAYNERSSRMLQRNDFLLEGRLRHAAFKGGRLTDSLVFGLTREGVEAAAAGEQAADG